MFNRFLFFCSIGLIGMVSGIGLWWMYRRGFTLLMPKWTVLFFVILPLMFVLPHIAIDHMPLTLTKICAWVGGYWFIFVFYSILLMVVYFLIFLGTALFHQPSLWQTLSHNMALYGGIAVALLVLAGSWNAFHPVYRDVTIRTNKPLSREITIAFVTDTHLGPIQSSWYSKALTERLNDAGADAIVFGGDIIDGNLPFVLADGSYKNFAALHAPLGVYAVYGNHDYFNGDLKKEAAEFKPIQFLQNDTITLADSIELTGLDDYLHDPYNNVPKPKDEHFQILVDHEPLRIPPASLAGYDLYLAGHTHGGQYPPISWLTERMYLLNYGTKTFAHMTAIVSNGYGFWGTPVRIGPAPEIVRIHIKSGQ